MLNLKKVSKNYNLIFKIMLFLKYAKIKRCKSGDLHTYVVPVSNCFVTGHMPGFFILKGK